MNYVRHGSRKLVSSITRRVCTWASLVTYGLAVYIVLMDTLLYMRLWLGSQTLADAHISIKKLMVGQMSFYIRTPLAYFLEDYFSISVNLPWLTANLISFTHVVLSFVSVKFLADAESLERRQLGCVIFHVRNFLDSLDGVIYRAHVKQTTFKSNYGSFGYLVDAVSDTVGGVCLSLGVALYLLKKRPVMPSAAVNSRASATACFRNTIDACDRRFLPPETHHSSSGENGGPGGVGYSLVIDMTDIDDHKKTSPRSSSSSIPTAGSVYATRLYVIAAAALLGIRLAASGFFWDRSVHIFSDLLDSSSNNKPLANNLTDIQMEMQMSYLSSGFTLFIMFAWRFMCAISLQDIILSAIFLDKIWEFMEKTLCLWWSLLFGLIILTEFHALKMSSTLGISF